MDTHELAEMLLKLPNETIFVRTEHGLKHIDKVYLCECKAEVIIELKKY